MQRPPHQQRLPTLDRNRLGQEKPKTVLCLSITRELLMGSMSITREFLAMQSLRPHPQLPESESAFFFLSRPEGDEPTHESLSDSAVSHKSVTLRVIAPAAARDCPGCRMWLPQLPHVIALRALPAEFLQQALQTCGSPGPDETQEESSKGKRKEERICKTAHICSVIRSADRQCQRKGRRKALDKV